MSSAFELLKKEAVDHLARATNDYIKVIDYLFKHKQNLNWLWAWSNAVADNEEGVQTPRVYTSFVSEKAHFHLLVRNLDGFTDPLVERILSDLEEFNNAGCKCKTKAVVTCDDLPIAQCRTFKYEWEFATVEIDLYLKDDAANCKRIKVGVDVYETPRYEFVCN